MSLLTLRVVGEKKHVVRQTNGKGPSLEKIIEICKSNGDISELQEDLDNLSLAETLEKQLFFLKVLLTRSCMVNSNEDFVYKLFSNIYMNVEPKNPLRSGIVRLLTNSSIGNVKTEERIVSALVEDIESVVEMTRTPFVIAETNITITRLIGCFENFPIGARAVTSRFADVMGLVCYSLEMCLSQLLLREPELSPAARLEVCQCVHGCIRLGVLLLQNSPHGSYHHYFSSLCSLRVRNLLESAVLPLDTATNCGLLIVLCTRVLDGRTACIEMFEEYRKVANDVMTIPICSGLLNGMPVEDLAFDNCSIFRHIVDSLNDIYERNPADCTVLLSLSRVLVVLSRSVLSSPTVLVELPDLLPFLLSFAWLHFDHHMDSVCHLANSLLVNVIKLGSSAERSVEELKILQRVLNLMVETPVWKRAKHGSLQALAGVIPTSRILASEPALIETLLTYLQQPTVPSYAMNSVENLMLEHLKEVDSASWTAAWLEPLLAAMGRAEGQSHLKGLQQLLTKAVRLSPQIVDYVLSLEHCNWSVSFSCLHACRKWGLKMSDDNNVDKWRGLASYSFLTKALYDRDSQVRLSCFSLLVDCKKTTEQFRKEELDLMRDFFKFSINESDTAARHQMVSLVSKLLARIKDSSQALVKNRLEKLHDEYQMFCEWLVLFCFSNLFPGATLCRRSTALTVLTMCRDLDLWPEAANTADNARLLLLSLSDSYEDNKAVASKLISAMPPKLFSFDDEKCVEEMFNECLRLGSSFRPPDSVTAAHLIGTLTRSPVTAVHLSAVSGKPLDCVMGGVYCAVSAIMDRLEEQLKIAQRDLLAAAGHGPLHGQMFLIRHILEQTNLEVLSQSEGWRLLISRLVTMCFECSEAVASIVNSDSPEGHLPMDFDYDVSGLTEGGEKTEGTVKVTAQMVLLCSWRTVKEASLILGHLAKLAPITSEEAQGLLTEDQLLSIGDHLTRLLAETKHRGAFEQAYVGFCKLTSRLWSFPSGNLHTVPRRWLQETIEEIAVDSKLCATRRSAGIPYMIQALVCTELSVGGGTCFSTCMERLLQLANSKEHTVETRTHSLNILRALFRNSQLGESVSPYVQDTFIIAISGFKSSSWPERNSATLLLTALMTRVFGVPRTKGTILSWKNKMTGRIFFQRYPRLYEFLLDELKSAETDCQLKPTLYPVLLLLSRLYPSSLEGTDTNLKLTAFIPAVTNCAGAAVLRTRSLSARAVVSLVTPNIFLEHLDKLFRELMCCPQENLTHGLLLQAIQLLQTVPSLTKSCEEEMHKKAETWIANISRIFSRSEPRHSHTVYSAFIDVLCLLHKRFCYPDNYSVWNEIEKSIANHLFDEKSYSVGINQFSAGATELLFRINVVKFESGTDIDNEFIDFVIRLLGHKLYEVQNKTLAILYCLLSEKSATNEEYSAVYRNFVNLDLPKLRCIVLSSNKLAKLILAKLLSPNTHPHDFLKLLEVAVEHPLVIKLLNDKDRDVKFLIELIMSRSCHEPALCLAIACLTRSVQFWNNCWPHNDGDANVSCLEEDKCDLICSIIVDSTLPESSSASRVVAAQWLRSPSFDVFLKASNLSSVQRLDLWNSWVTLSCDEDTAVQNILFHTHCQLKSLKAILRKFVEEETNVVVKAVALTAWVLGQMDFSIFDCIQEEKAFDSGELDSVFEEAVLSRLASKHLKILLEEDHRSALTAEVPRQLAEWLANCCRLQSVSNAKSILEVRNLVESEISHRNLDLGSGYCSFLKPGYKTVLLARMKLKNFHSDYS